MFMARILKQKRIVFFAIFLFLVLSIFVILSIPFGDLSNFSNSSFVTLDELNLLEKGEFFGPFISVKVRENQILDVSNFGDFYEPIVEFKLFHLIPIKTQKLKVIKMDKINVGGCAIGLVLETDGVLVVGSSPVTTDNGEFDALKDSDLKLGDTILQIENERVENTASISKIINEEKNKDRELKVLLKRKGEVYETRLKPCYDTKNKNYKLGIWARDDASGIGTLTYIDENNRFGALGHPICDSDTKSQIDLKSGSVYKCSVLGVEKGVSGKPGELKGLFMQGKNEQGVVEKNNAYGIFGTIKDDSSLLSCTEKMDIGGRLSVRPGKAQIRCCLDGNKVETFDVEIIKTNYQSSSNDKSMVLRVTDKNLIERTGGIVQGMSGSPIIQNGKIVGAVTHVFVSDPTKGFGVYIDWMIDE